jgi:hypothetical protein
VIRATREPCPHAWSGWTVKVHRAVRKAADSDSTRVDLFEVTEDDISRVSARMVNDPEAHPSLYKRQDTRQIVYLLILIDKSELSRRLRNDGCATHKRLISDHGLRQAISMTVVEASSFPSLKTEWTRLANQPDSRFKGL